LQRRTPPPAPPPEGENPPIKGEEIYKTFYKFFNLCPAMENVKRWQNITGKEVI